MRSVLLTACLLIIAAAPALAQDYGTGASANVPYVEPETIIVDGTADEPAWENALVIDPLANWDGGWSGHPEPDIFSEARLLYTDGALFLHVIVEDIDFMTDPGTDHLLLGIDLVHEAGVSDTLSDPNFGGFVDNAPNLGPVTYKLFAGNDTIPSISLNFSDEVSPPDSGWVIGSFFLDEEDLVWGFEIAIQAEEIAQGSQIGFNLGGGAAKEEGLEDRGEAAYAFYSWQVCDPEAQEGTFFCGAGGTVMSDAHSFGTLNLIAPGSQVYGTGAVVDVPYLENAQDVITLDGLADEEAWAGARVIDPLANWDGGWSGHPEPDIFSEARLLYTDEALIVHMLIEDIDLMSDAGTDHILLGVDLRHQAGISDQEIDEGFGGFVDNAPDGPVTYKIFAGNDSIPSISLNFSTDVSPVDSGWVDGVVLFDEESEVWGVELVIMGEQVAPGNQIGFNIGGGAAKEEGLEDRGEAAYAFYSWQVCDPATQANTFFCGAGGTIMSDAHSFGTLNLLEPGQISSYGTGVVATVPRIEPGTLSLDGSLDEAAWEQALVIDPLANWDGGWSGHPEPDIFAEARLLYSEDSLFIGVAIEDVDLMFDPGADHILLGLDFVHAPGVSDQMIDEGFGGFVDNAPEGPVTYKIFAGNDSIPAISLNFSTDISPVDSGWVAGEVVFDEESQTWGLEAAFVSNAVREGGQVGFNIGGGAAKEEGLEDRGEAAYAFYSWQVCDPETQENTFFCGGGGTIMSDAHSFATLTFGTDVGIEEEKLSELPSAYQLQQNYPNPFNPTTTIEYGLTQLANVRLEVFNLLGQKVATLVNEPRAAGTYRVTWEATDLSSGVYVYQLRVDDMVVQSRKMLLVK